MQWGAEPGISAPRLKLLEWLFGADRVNDNVCGQVLKSPAEVLYMNESKMPKDYFESDNMGVLDSMIDQRGDEVLISLTTVQTLTHLVLSYFIMSKPPPCLLPSEVPVGADGRSARASTQPTSQASPRCSQTLSHFQRCRFSPFLF